ncbi:MAG: hypothetical protein HC880_05835 [Bacteroidia bacterium]|nr:hypothetical protein [Bacteroidia bacterium]
MSAKGFLKKYKVEAEEKIDKLMQGVDMPKRSSADLGLSRFFRIPWSNECLVSS